MNRKGFLQGNDRMIPPSLAIYESYKAKDESLYLDSEEFADIVDYYIELKLFDKAIEAVNDGISIHPNNTRILLEQAYIHLEQEEIDKAIKVTEQIPDQTYYDVLILRADLALRENKKEEAYTLLNSIEQKNEEDTIIDIIYLLLHYKIYDEVKKWISLGDKLYGDNEDFLHTKANYLSITNQHNEAIETFDKLIDIDPFSAILWWGQAKAFFELSKFNKCIESCDFGIVIDATLWDFYVLKGQSYQHLEQHEEAIKCFQEALDRDCKSKDIVNILMSQSYAAMNNWDEVTNTQLNVLDQILEHPEESSILNKLTKALDASLQEFNMDEVANITSKGISNFLDKLQTLTDSYEENITPDDEVCKEITDTIKAFEREDYNKASQLLIDVESKAKTTLELSKLVDVYLSIGDHELARKTLFKIQETDPQDEIAKLKLACLDLLEGNEQDLKNIENIDITISEENLFGVCDYLKNQGEDELAKILLRHFTKLKE